MNEKKPTSEGVDEAYFEELSRRVESDDFELPEGVVVHRGGPEGGRAFLSQFMTEAELDEATQRGRGRPSLSGSGRSPSRQVRLPADLDALLVERAARDGRRLSDVLRAAVASYLRPPAA